MSPRALSRNIVVPDLASPLDDIFNEEDESNDVELDVLGIKKR